MSHVTHINESAPIPSRHIYEWVMSHGYGGVTSRTWLSHVTHAWVVLQKHICEWGMSLIQMSRVAYMNESCHIMNESCHMYECVVLHISNIYVTNGVENGSQRDRWSHVTYINKPCHMCEWAMSRISMSHVTYMNESCHTNRTESSLTSLLLVWRSSHITCMNEPCRIFEWAISYTSMSHVTHMNESCHTSRTESCLTSLRLVWRKSNVTGMNEWVVSYISIHLRGSWCGEWKSTRQ